MTRKNRDFFLCFLEKLRAGAARPRTAHSAVATGRTNLTRWLLESAHPLRLIASQRKNSLSIFYSGNDRQRKYFSRLKENRQSGSHFSFTISRRGSGDPESISKICS